MTRPTKSIILQNYTLELLMLPLGSRDLTSFQRTITLTTPVTENDDSVEITSSAASTVISAGTSLSFGATGYRRHQILFVENVTAGTSAVAAKVARTQLEIPTVSGVTYTANFLSGLTPLFGIQGFDLQSQETTVDTTNTQSGSGMESTMVRFDRTIAVTGVTMQGDRALETIVKRIVFDTAYTNREVYAVATYPNGEKYEGAAKIMGYSSPGNQNEVAKYQFNLQFQGDTLVRTQAYHFA